MSDDQIIPGAPKAPPKPKVLPPFFCYELSPFGTWTPTVWHSEPTELPREKKGDRSALIPISEDDAKLSLNQLSTRYPPPSKPKTE